jgi:hypothetical protein
LNLNVVLFEIRLDGFGGDIVNNVEDGLEASFGQVLNVCFENSDGGFIFAVLDRCGKDGVAGPIVEDEDGRHAVHRTDWEFFSGEVNINSAVFVADAAGVAE